jgi:hypothetical protein
VCCHDGGERALTTPPDERDDFQRAAAAAREKHGKRWVEISTKLQASAIYEELRRIDAENVAGMVKIEAAPTKRKWRHRAQG